MARRVARPRPPNGHVETGETATRLVVKFLQQHGRRFVRAVSAKRTAGVWTVHVDVGTFTPKIGTFHVDAETGAIRDYEIAA